MHSKDGGAGLNGRINREELEGIGGPVVKNLLWNAGDKGSIPGQELSSCMPWGMAKLR